MSVATANLPSLPSSLTPEGNLSRYLSDIRKFPLLEPQEEFMLATRWREHGDSKAAHRLVTAAPPGLPAPLCSSNCPSTGHRKPFRTSAPSFMAVPSFP